MLSTGEDLRYPTTTGARATAVTRLQHRYLDRVVAAAIGDPGIADTYTRVLGLLARPTALFAPRVIAAAARARSTDDAGPPPPSPASAADPVRPEAARAEPVPEKSP
jgi:hypothetical protein